MPEMPPLIRDLMTMINRMPVTSSDHWRRLRIAITQQELDEYREFIRKDGDGVNFVYAVRGVSLQIEEYPTHPLFILENLHAKSSPTPK